MNLSASVQKQSIVLGNKCGHDRLNPKSYSRPKTQKRRYHILEELQRRLIEARDINPYKYGLAALLFHNKNNKSRRIRSELKEAVFFCLQKVIDYTDVYSLQFGCWDNKNKFRFYNGYTTIAKESKISLRRVGKAMRFLQSKGIVTVFPIKKVNEKGEYRTEKTIITLDPKIFELASLTEEYNEDFLRAAKNHEKREEKIKIECEVHNRKIDFFKTKQNSKIKPHKTRLTSPNNLKSSCASGLNKQTKSYNPRQDKRIMELAQALQSQCISTDPISMYKEIISFLESESLMKKISHSNVMTYIRSFYKDKSKYPPH
jgi:hypothetical protein